MTKKHTYSKRPGGFSDLSQASRKPNILLEESASTAPVINLGVLVLSLFRSMMVALLRRSGHCSGRTRVRALMREQGLVCSIRKRFRHTSRKPSAAPYTLPKTKLLMTKKHTYSKRSSGFSELSQASGKPNILLEDSASTAPVINPASKIADRKTEDQVITKHQPHDEKYPIFTGESRRTQPS